MTLQQKQDFHDILLALNQAPGFIRASIFYFVSFLPTQGSELRRDLDGPHGVLYVLLQDSHRQSSTDHFCFAQLHLLLPAELFIACTPRELHIRSRQQRSCSL